MLVGVDPEPIH